VASSGINLRWPAALRSHVPDAAHLALDCADPLAQVLKSSAMVSMLGSLALRSGALRPHGTRGSTPSAWKATTLRRTAASSLEPVPVPNPMSPSGHHGVDGQDDGDEAGAERHLRVEKLEALLGRENPEPVAVDPHRPIMP
jgi:hypothetical protein